MPSHTFVSVSCLYIGNSKLKFLIDFKSLASWKMLEIMLPATANLQPGQHSSASEPALNHYSFLFHENCSYKRAFPLVSQSH